MRIEGRADPILISTNDVRTRIIFAFLESCSLITIADIELTDEKEMIGVTSCWVFMILWSRAMTCTIRSSYKFLEVFVRESIFSWAAVFRGTSCMLAWTSHIQKAAQHPC